MARVFLSPEESRLLRDLPDREAQLVADLMEHLDAHLVADPDTHWMLKPPRQQAREITK